MSVPPVQQKNRPHELRFPFNKRDLLSAGARCTSRKASTCPTRSNRRNGTAAPTSCEGLGHCAMCHTAINALGGSSESKAFEGGMIPNQNWYAPSLTSNREAGLGNWSIKDIADLLQVGVSHRGTVYGPMAEVVYNSLQYLTDEDVEAMAVYLKALPQRDAEPPPTSQARLVEPERHGDSAARSTRRSARCATAPKARGSRRSFRRSPATSRSRWRRRSTRSAWC